jgi:hypothetical protein
MILLKRLSDTEALLTAWKQRKIGKRIKLKDKYIFSTREVLKIEKEAELQASHKKAASSRTSKLTTSRSVAMNLNYLRMAQAKKKVIAQ